MRHRGVAGALVCALAGPLGTACREAPVARPARSVTIGVLQPVGTIDPRLATLRAETELGRLLYERLLQVDSLGLLRPWFATRWSVRPDGRTLRFTLPPNRRFHSGAPANAAALVAAFSPAREDSIGRARYAPLFAAVDGGQAFLERRTDRVAGLVAVDDTTLDVRFVAAPPDAALFASARLAIRGPRASDAVADGTGAWRLVRIESPRTRFALVRVRPAAGYPDTLYYQVLASAAIDSALRSGAVDCVPLISAATRTALSTRSDLILHDNGPVSLHMVLFGPRQPLWRDLRARRALSMAIDRRALIEAYAPVAGIATVGLRNPRGLGPRQRPDSGRYDPAAARAAFDSAGRTPGDTLRLAIVASSPGDSLAGPPAAVAAALRATGFTVTYVVTTTVVEALQAGAADLHVASYSMASYVDEPVLQLLARGALPDSIAGRQYVPEIATLERALRSAPVPAADAPSLDELDSLTRARLPIVGLWFAPSSAVSRRDVAGCGMDATSTDHRLLLRRTTDGPPT